MAQAWRSARRFSIAALVTAFTLMIAAALLGTPDVAVASANSFGRYAHPHVDVVAEDPLSTSPRPAPGPPRSPTAAAAAEKIVAAGVLAVPVPVPQLPAPDVPVLADLPKAQVAAPEVAAATAPPTHPAHVRVLDTERLGRSLVFTGGAAALIAGYGLVLVGFRRRLW